MVNQQLTDLVNATTSDLLNRVLPAAIAAKATPNQVAELANAINCFNSVLFDNEVELFQEQSEEFETQLQEYVDHINQQNEVIEQLEDQLGQLEQATAPANGNGNGLVAHGTLGNADAKTRLRSRLSRRGFGG